MDTKTGRLRRWEEDEEEEEVVETRYPDSSVEINIENLVSQY